MNFDPLANAVDWFDAYAAGDIDALVAMYAAEALLECRCAEGAELSGSAAVRAYWTLRLAQFPAFEIEELAMAGDRAMILYGTPSHLVRVELEFDASGAISRASCGPVTTQTR